MKKNLFRWLIALAILLPCMVISASAATRGYYEYSVSNGKATIIAVDTSISGAVTIPSTLGGYPVTTIGDWAFTDCSGLTSVTIPGSVTTIEDSAFRDCESLTSVTIGAGVTTIGDSAFRACDSLTQIKVATGNTAYCDVNGVLFSKDKTLLVQCPSRKTGGYTIPTGVTTIGEVAFSNCDSLTSVTIPDSVTSIGDGAFAGCTGLASVTIPDSVTSIGNSTFSSCSGLTGVTIPDSVISIEDFAFVHCSSLTSVTIPDSVTSIGNYVFYYCYNLTRVDFLCDMPTSVGTNVFEYCDEATLYYHAGTSGWPTDGTWQGRPLEMQPHTEAVLSAVSPTCGATGLTEGSYCDVCGEVLLAQTEVPTLGHDIVDHAAKAPTTESVGWEAYQTCSRCDYTTYKELPKLEEDKPVVSATQFKFSLEVIKTIKVNGQNVDICRWVWTPFEG